MILPALILTAFGQASPTSPLIQHWEGEITFRGSKMPIRLDLVGESKNLTVLMDFPQLVYAQVPQKSRIEDSMISVDLPFGLGALQWKLESDEASAKLSLGKEAADVTLKRDRGYTRPYMVERFAFRSKGREVGGLVSVPEGDGPFPAVVLVHGAANRGPSDWGYGSWADFFARRGFVALSYEKRTDGDREIDLEELTADAIAAADAVRQDRRVDSKRIGMHGGSQAGWIMAHAAKTSPIVSFIVATSPPALPPAQQEAVYIKEALRAEKLPAAQLRAAEEYVDLYFRVAVSGKGYPELEKATKGALEQPWGEVVQTPTKESDLHWWRRNGTYGGESPWKGVEKPVLFAFGGSDLICPPAIHGPLIHKAMKQSQNEMYSVNTYSGADHRLEVKAGMVDGKWRWPMMAPGLLDEIDHFLHFKPMGQKEWNTHQGLAPRAGG
jgi:dienelactone hydrolase